VAATRIIAGALEFDKQNRQHKRGPSQAEQVGALRTMAVARALDMRIMLSCMVESSLGVTAAVHIAPLADYADLDGPLLITNDPFVGLRYEGARMTPPDGPGPGLRAK
jgi:L-alanine-DL-glutamate epimerase-like enolase superfamily enzyme